MADRELPEAITAVRDSALTRIAEARESISQAQLAMSQARSDLDKVDAFIALWSAHVGAEQGVAASSNAVEIRQTQDQVTRDDGVKPVAPKRAKGNPKKEAVAAVAREIIIERGKPIQRAPLFAAIKDRGFVINGYDPEMVFSTMLWRVKDAVIRLPEFGYWLPERPFEPAGYDPKATTRASDIEELKMSIAATTGQLPELNEEDDEPMANDVLGSNDSDHQADPVKAS